MNLVTGSILTDFTGAFANHFDTFSHNVTLIVFKEPLKIINAPTEAYFGYSQNQDSSNITYQVVSGSFPALKVFSDPDKDLFALQSKTRNADSIITIKVKGDAKDYIINGKNEKIMLDGVTYNDISFYKVQNYFGLKYYYFDLKQTY